MFTISYFYNLQRLQYLYLDQLSSFIMEKAYSRKLDMPVELTFEACTVNTYYFQLTTREHKAQKLPKNKAHAY